MKLSIHVKFSIILLLSAFIIAFAIYLKPEGRYQFAVSTPPDVIWILDTRDGTVVDMRESSVKK